MALAAAGNATDVVPATTLGRRAASGPDSAAVLRTGAGRYPPVHPLRTAGAGPWRHGPAGVPRLPGAAVVHLPAHRPSGGQRRAATGLRCAGAAPEPAGAAGDPTTHYPGR